MAGNGKETKVVSSGGGGAGWFVAGALLVIVLIGGYVFLGGDIPSNNDAEIKIDLPDS